MPFYRLDLGMVHVKGSKLPAPCAAQVQIDGKHQVCLAPSDYLCDGPAEGRKTCDKPLCEAHAHEIGRNKHLCPPCHLNHLDASGQRSLFTSLI